MRSEKDERRKESICSEDAKTHCWEAVSPVCGARRDWDGEEDDGDGAAQSAEHQDVVDLDSGKDLRGDEDGDYCYESA